MNGKAVVEGPIVEDTVNKKLELNKLLLKLLEVEKLW